MQLPTWVGLPGIVVDLPWVMVSSANECEESRERNELQLGQIQTTTGGVKFRGWEDYSARYKIVHVGVSGIDKCDSA